MLVRKVCVVTIGTYQTTAVGEERGDLATLLVNLLDGLDSVYTVLVDGVGHAKVGDFLHRWSIPGSVRRMLESEATSSIN